MVTLRHLAAILALPFVVVAVVPAVLLGTVDPIDTRWDGPGRASLLLRGVGVLLFLAGLLLWGWCVWLFARVGRGTLAPWDPTRRLVVVGPYRHVRNPMIAGVLAMLAGEGFFFGSVLLFVWAAGFWLLNHLYFVRSEEPGLARRFGDPYREYVANVPRWLPRRIPWTAEEPPR